MTFLMFKGSFFYELQIGKLVFQLRHTSDTSATGIIFKLPLFKVWVDPFGKWA